MKVAFISDLHVDLNKNYSETQFQTVIQQMTQEEQIEQWVIGGDISNSYRTSLSFVEKLQNVLRIPVFFVPGNHDYWEKDRDEKHTRDIYQAFVAHPQCLIEKPLELNETTVLFGHSGWYNYAFAAERFTTEELTKGSYNGRTWQDKLNVDWQKHDLEVSKEFASIVADEMEQYKDKQKLLLTHIVTIPEFSVALPHDMFDYLNAFIGTNDYQPLIETYKPSHVVMGHVHYRRELEKEATTYICCCLGYMKEWRTEDLYTEVKDSTYILTI